MKTIRPDLLAARFAAAANGDQPDFARWLGESPCRAEMLWFIQHASFQPGGLSGMVAQMVKMFPDRFQTKAMLAAQMDRHGLYTIEQCIKVWNDEDFRANEYGHLTFKPLEVFDPGPLERRDITFEDLLTHYVGKETPASAASGDNYCARAIRGAVKKFNRPWLKARCESNARASLPGLLSDFCQNEEGSFPTPGFCPELESAIIDYMGAHAREVSEQIAETVISKTVHRELEFARTECVPVPIVGESRFGKTKAISNWCDKHPGRARLVTVPNNNREIDFMRAHADAFGIEYTRITSCPILADKVEFVVRHARCLVVYDEAHALVPVNYHDATPPRRLNWVRSKLIDRGVPCAFFATPQSYKQTLARYAETTGYRIEQWLGRMAPTVILSDVIPFEEVVAVARTQFPELSQALLEELADRAILSDGYLKNIEITGRRARFLARERGHDKPSKQDVLDACADMMPSEPRVVTDLPRTKPPARKTPSLELPPRSSRLSDRAPEAGAPEFPRRSSTPARLLNESLTEA